MQRGRSISPADDLKSLQVVGIELGVGFTGLLALGLEKLGIGGTKPAVPAVQTVAAVLLTLGWRSM